MRLNAIVLVVCFLVSTNATVRFGDDVCMVRLLTAVSPMCTYVAARFLDAEADDDAGEPFVMGGKL